MTLHIGNAVPEVKSEETEVALHNDHAPQDLFRIMEWATPCSPWVFYGLLAWASLNAPGPMYEGVCDGLKLGSSRKG